MNTNKDFDNGLEFLEETNDGLISANIGLAENNGEQESCIVMQIGEFNLCLLRNELLKIIAALDIEHPTSTT